MSRSLREKIDFGVFGVFHMVCAPSVAVVLAIIVQAKSLLAGIMCNLLVARPFSRLYLTVTSFLIIHIFPVIIMLARGIAACSMQS